MLLKGRNSGQDMTNWVERVEQAIGIAQADSARLSNGVFKLPGCSGRKIQTVLNELCYYSDTRYLEIGLADGKTFCSALYDNKPEVAFGIEKDAGKVYGSIANNLKQHVMYYSPTVIAADCWGIDKSQFTDINVYFYDAGHSESDQRKAITEYIGCMAKQFVFLVDDWFTRGENGPRLVSETTTMAIDSLGLKVLFRADLGENAPPKSNINEWWNGLGVFVLEKP